jgi:hypothetical protein
MQQRQADETRGVSRAELSHRLGAMALEGPWADLHPQGALLVGVTLADETENLTLAARQGLLAAFGRKHHARRAVFLGVAGAAVRSRLAAGCRGRPLVSIRHLLDHGTDALGLLKRVLDHLLQIIRLPAACEICWLFCLISPM